MSKPLFFNYTDDAPAIEISAEAQADKDVKKALRFVALIIAALIIVSVAVPSIGLIVVWVVIYTLAAAALVAVLVLFFALSMSS